MAFSFWVFWSWIFSFRYFTRINLLSVAPSLGASGPKVKKYLCERSRIGTSLGSLDDYLFTLVGKEFILGIGM